jgi:hypothetical protein
MIATLRRTMAPFMAGIEYATCARPATIFSHSFLLQNDQPCMADANRIMAGHGAVRRTAPRQGCEPAWCSATDDNRTVRIRCNIFHETNKTTCLNIIL